ncbi:Plasmodium exported protein (Pm-fam-a like), unknown function [Plasmodium malariae]|uniref:Uncharacterized protein n=1 Tax=Plasmodium malariae TaxID=5858 RepID=A0A1A8WNQ1_PLAMA|nr:Plasmodium exported protein (Pm-fam-a like), unknown function [Plasmodium malariae]
MYKYGRNVHMRTYRLLAKCKQDKDSSIIGLKQNISNNGSNEKNDICYNEKGTSTKKEQPYESSLRNSKGHKEDLKNKSSKCKQDKDSSIIGLKQNISNNGSNEKNDICYNEKGTSTKKEQPYESSLRNSKGHKEDLKNKSCIFETKKYSHMEKKIFKELDYVDFLKNSKTLNDKTYKKIIGKKLVFRFSLPVLLLLFFIAVVIAEFSLGSTGSNSLLFKLGLTKDNLNSWAENSTLSLILTWLMKLEGFWKHGNFWGSSTNYSYIGTCLLP